MWIKKENGGEIVMKTLIKSKNYLEELKGVEIKMREFKDLKAYKIAMELATECREIANQLPEFEEKILSDQLRRSVSKLGPQVAEGKGQFYKKEEIRFYSIATGSVCETQCHLELCLACGYITEEKFKELDNKADQFKALVIKYVQKLINE